MTTLLLPDLIRTMTPELPTAEGVVIDGPPLVSAYSVHEGVLNSPGLAAMGWDRRTPNLPNGVLRRESPAG